MQEKAKCLFLHRAQWQKCFGSNFSLKKELAHECWTLENLNSYQIALRIINRACLQHARILRQILSLNSFLVLSVQNSRRQQWELGKHPYKLISKEFLLLHLKMNPPDTKRSKLTRLSWSSSRLLQGLKRESFSLNSKLLFILLICGLEEAQSNCK